MELRIFHTNDIHSSFDRLAGIAGYLKAHRRPQDLYFDCGDLCDLKNLMVQGTKGLGVINLLQSMNAAAMAVGNNEIDLEHPALTDCAKAGLPLLSCNLTDNDGNPVEGIRPSMVLTAMGLRILLIGASPYFGEDGRPGAYNVFYAMGDLVTTDPLPAIQRELEEQRGNYDFCILLSHGGKAAELEMMERFPEIGLCLGGHSHSLCSLPRYNQVGRFGSHLGLVTLTIEEGRVTDIKTQALENTFPPDADFLSLLEGENRRAMELLSVPLYSIEALTWSATEESPLTNFIADALYAEYPCDLAFINAGIVEGSIAGEVSKQTLLALSPSKLNPTRLPLSGKALRQAIAASLDESFVRQDGHGPGVRGKILGTLGFSHNVKISMDSMEIQINGKPLEDHRVYDCMADDSLQRGTGYFMLETPDSQAEFYRGFIRDLLERTLCREELHRSCREPRLIRSFSHPVSSE